MHSYSSAQCCSFPLSILIGAHSHFNDAFNRQIISINPRLSPLTISLTRILLSFDVSRCDPFQESVNIQQCSTGANLNCFILAEAETSPCQQNTGKHWCHGNLQSAGRKSPWQPLCVCKGEMEPMIERRRDERLCRQQTENIFINVLMLQLCNIQEMNNVRTAGQRWVNNNRNTIP